MKNVLEWLEATVAKYPDKPAFSDTECSITFAQVYDIARNTGAYLIEQLGVDRTPVAVFAGRKNGDTGILPGCGICRQTVCTD